MDFIRLTEDCMTEMTEMFFKRIVYIVWYFYKDYECIQFLSTDGKLYTSAYTEEFTERFPIIEDRHYYKKWTRYLIGYGEIFVRNDILDSYKKHAGIDDNCTEYEPNFEAALKALEDWKIRRADRFTWQPGDLVFYSSVEEMIESAKKEGKTVRLYGHNGAPDTIISPD